jgi:hypothetical protein
VELLVAHCYTAALPFSAPATPLAGFMRFLWKLAVTDFEVSALVVDLSVGSEDGAAGASLSPQAYREWQDAAEEARAAAGRRPVPLCLCTVADKGGVRWTRQGLTKMLLHRAVTEARRALACMSRGLARGSAAALSGSLQASASLRDFDVVIHLHSGAALLKVAGLGAQAFKNTRRKLQTQLLVGLSPVDELLRRLRQSYGKYALFWADTARGDSIAVLWLPSSPGSLSVATAENMFPLALAEASGGGGSRGRVVPDTVSMLCGIKALGEGLVKEIHVVAGARVVE